jgi:hypothetical protein
MSATDWFSLATAVGTLALAMATFSMARKTADAAGASRDLLNIERDQLRQGYLPVMVPVIKELRVGQTLPVAEHGENSMIIRNDNTTTVFIPVQNIGVGPALGVEVDLYWLDQNGEESVAGQPLRFPTRFGGLPPEGGREVAAKFAGLAANPPLPSGCRSSSSTPPARATSRRGGTSRRRNGSAR